MNARTNCAVVMANAMFTIKKEMKKARSVFASWYHKMKSCSWLTVDSLILLWNRNKNHLIEWQHAAQFCVQYTTTIYGRWTDTTGQGDDGERVVDPHSSSVTLSFSCCYHTALPLLSVLPHSGGIYPINRKKTSRFTYVLLIRHKRGLDSK